MQQIIAVIGPTAVGKTKLSIDLAKKLGGEIISGDSMLVYRGFDIGTAKPDLAERAGVVHHLIDILEPQEEFNVHLFQNMAEPLTAEINSRGAIPILAGGTGLYVKALLEGYRFNETKEDSNLRRQLTEIAQTYGNQKLHSMLAEKRPDIAARLHPNDIRRIIRALEVYHDGGGTQIFQKKPHLLDNALVIGLTMDRTVLYQRINQRVDSMIERGLLEEVDGLLKSGVPSNCQAMQGIGYKEIAAYLSGEIGLFEAIENIKQATRNFAKRQLTWYRKMPYIKWIDLDEKNSYPEILKTVSGLLAEKFSIRYNNKK